MNRAIKKLFFIFMLMLIFLFYTKSVSANTINQIDMDVSIDSNGNASITETWQTYLNQGTEGYRSYTNLGNSKITNFIISDDSGITYKSISNWNSSASFESKAYKNGIHSISDGVELCWGISNYGKRTYTLNYKISNFITQYTDTQGFYFNFIDLDQSIGRARITIHSDKKFSTENAKIWAFGNNGTINFIDNNIVLDSGGVLSKSQYMVALVKFEGNIFNTSNKFDGSFSDIYNSAMEGTTNNSEMEKSKEEILKFFSIYSKDILLWIIPIILVIFMKITGKNWLWGSNEKSGQLEFGVQGNSIPSEDKIEYWREIPCNKDLEMAYWVCLKYNVISYSTLKQGIIGAILLKWLKSGYIKISKTRTGLFSFKDNNYAIDFTQMTSAENEIENQLFKILIVASGNNKILEAKEFEKWCKKNYYKVQQWFSTLIKKEEFYLEHKGLLKASTKQVTGILGSKRTITVKNVDPQLREEAIKLKGLKKFLLDFSMMPEKEYIEVHIWEEYLIFAQLLGIAEKVEEQFSKLYPDFNQKTLLNTELSTIAIRNMVAIGYKGIETGIRRANSSTSHRDHGTGGGSYSSGGNSSGGSSGGGFR